MATSQSIDVGTGSGSSDSDSIVHAENHEDSETTRFTFSQIHQYLQFGTYPSHFQKSDKLALRKRSKYFKTSDGDLYYVGGGISYKLK